MDKYEEIVEIGKSYETIEEVEKFNPYHGKDGRFSGADSYASFTFATKDPNKQYMADMSIMRRMQQNEAARASGKGQPLKNPTGNLQEDKRREMEGADYAVQFVTRDGKTSFSAAEFNSDKKDAKGGSYAEAVYDNMKIYASQKNGNSSQIYMMDEKSAQNAVEATNSKLRSGAITSSEVMGEFERQVAAQSIRTITSDYIAQQNEARRNLAR